MSSLIDIGKKQADLFIQDNVTYMELLITGNGTRMIMCSCYNSLCGSGRIVPIENITAEQKMSIWETAKEFSNGRLNKEQMIELSKSLYALEYFLNL